MDVKRRTVLAVASSVGLAGCLSGITPREPPVLNCLSIINSRNESLAVRIEIEHGGTTVTNQTIEIRGEKGSSVARKWVTPTWPTDPAPFTVRASLENHNETERLESGDLPEGVPLHEMIHIDGRGIAFFQRANSNPDEQCQHAGEKRALNNSSEG